MTTTTESEDMAFDAAMDADNDVADAAEDADRPEQESAIALLPPARMPGMGAITTLREHVGAMREAKFFAEGMCYTEMVPTRFRGKPADGAAAILFGAEVGLSPIASLRSVIVIHGQPGLEARTMKALLKTKGFKFRTVEKTATRCEIWAWEPDSPVVLDGNGRRINPDEEAVWTIEDCITEGWVPTPVAGSERRPNVKDDWVTVSRNGKTSVVGNMKYITSPKTMLIAKATAEVCRGIAPELLLGLPYSGEELEDWSDDDESYDEPVRREPRRARGTAGLRERAAAASGRAAAEEYIEGVVVDDEETPQKSGSGAADVAPEPTATAGPAAATGDTAAAPDPTPEPAVTITKEEGVTGEDLPGPSANTPDEPPADEAQVAASDTALKVDTPPEQQPDDGDAKMSPATRKKGSDLMHALFGEAGLKADDRAERLAATAEIIAKRPGVTWRSVESSADLSNTELKWLVDTLRGAKSKGLDTLRHYVGEAINAASLREAGLFGDDNA